MHSVDGLTIYHVTKSTIVIVHSLLTNNTVSILEFLNDELQIPGLFTGTVGRVFQQFRCVIFNVREAFQITQKTMCIKGCICSFYFFSSRVKKLALQYYKKLAKFDHFKPLFSLDATASIIRKEIRKYILFSISAT